MSWRRAGLSIGRNIVYKRRLCTATRRRRVEDEGDWFYSSEWWGTESDGHTILRTGSDHGNGVVSVLAYPSSRPAQTDWPKTENWLQERYAAAHPSHQKKGRLKMLRYQWRTLHFNETTRQSTAKVMAAYHDLKPGSMFLMQQPHCLAVPYLKSMAATGLSALACSDYDLAGVAFGKKKMRVLCIGHGGGSLPLFLASKLQGVQVDIVEIDPVVISTSIQAMGFPAFSLMNRSGQRSTPSPCTIWMLFFGKASTKGSVFTKQMQICSS
ncbi:unnamed protein product [Linum trigynum]|uniref:Uncharacterized protein n=1 Tax=Linum trigynum TaxID=586398 RepID=A0AAV2CJR8_9ROSI